jgi:hypothetical protein
MVAHAAAGRHPPGKRHFAEHMRQSRGNSCALQTRRHTADIVTFPALKRITLLAKLAANPFNGKGSAMSRPAQPARFLVGASFFAKTGKALFENDA